MEAGVCPEKRATNPELKTLHVGYKRFPSQFLPVLAILLSLAPDQPSLSDNQIAEMGSGSVTNVKFNAFVFHIHGNIKVLD